MSMAIVRLKVVISTAIATNVSSKFIFGKTLFRKIW